LAWDPFGDGKTSIRAAAGLFYGSVSGNEWNSTSNFQPFAVRQQFPNVTSLTNPYGALTGGVSPFPFIYSPSSPRFIHQREMAFMEEAHRRDEADSGAMRARGGGWLLSAIQQA